MRICSQQRFTPVEAFRLGIFLPDFDERNLDRLISRKALTKIQKRLNPENKAGLAKNKLLFYRHCAEHGLPVPEVYDLKEQHSPSSFVIKPVFGAYGKGVYVFRRQGDRLIDHTGKYYSDDELVSFCRSSYPDGFVVQKCVENHFAIVELTGCEALQTVRLITFVDEKNIALLLHAHFKPINRPGIVIDTYIEGLTGNVEVPVNIETGILADANQITGTGRGIVTVTNHPFTGRAFAGFNMPDWRRVCELVKKAAYDFLPLRTIGWDVAICPDGPYIIEGNVWWDPPDQHLNMNKILEPMKVYIKSNESE